MGNLYVFTRGTRTAIDWDPYTTWPILQLTGDPYYMQSTGTHTTIDWGPILHAIDFAHLLETAYSEVMHWRRKLFWCSLVILGRILYTRTGQIVFTHCTASSMKFTTLRVTTVLPTGLLNTTRCTAEVNKHIMSHAWRSGWESRKWVTWMI